VGTYRNVRHGLGRVITGGVQTDRIDVEMSIGPAHLTHRIQSTLLHRVEAPESRLSRVLQSSRLYCNTIVRQNFDTDQLVPCGSYCSVSDQENLPE
jgi:hypothetical protein